MKRALSKDGTPIAFERSGIGRPLILVDGALCSRSFGPMPKPPPALRPPEARPAVRLSRGGEDGVIGGGEPPPKSTARSRPSTASSRRGSSQA